MCEQCAALRLRALENLERAASGFRDGGGFVFAFHVGDKLSLARLCGGTVFLREYWVIIGTSRDDMLCYLSRS